MCRRKSRFQRKILTRQKKEEEFTYPDVTDEQFFGEVLTRAVTRFSWSGLKDAATAKAARPTFLKRRDTFP